MKTGTKLAWLAHTAGLPGWVWILASLAALYFLAAAVAFHGAWSRLWWALACAAVAKWLARGFIDNQRRVAFEADLISKGYSAEEAGKEWIKRYSRNQSLDPGDSPVAKN
jgi:hypothetical protein